ncbi:hypothetical protein B0H11DRAFT_2019278 [Mycena galericulata]|nr:hypothetical protein B0H11DRAFT_2019278 [Mycena galericulata]
MSNTPPPGPPPLPANLVADQRLEHVLFLVAFLVLTYDYFLTLPAEIHFIWMRRKRPSSYWFILNRYLALSTTILMAIFTFADFRPQICPSLLLAEKLFLLAQEIVIYVILVQRVYAMWNLNRRILALLCLSGLSVLGISAWLVTTNTAPPPPPPGAPPLPGGPSDDAPNHDNGTLPSIPPPQCAQVIFHPSAIRIAGAWEAEFALDAVIFGLTVFRAFIHRRRGEWRSELLSCLFRDGAFYFFVIGLANMANIWMYYEGDPMLAGSLAWLANSLSTALLARLMLNLHAVADAGIFKTAEAGAWVSSGNEYEEDEDGSIGGVVFVHVARVRAGVR